MPDPVAVTARTTGQPREPDKRPAQSPSDAVTRGPLQPKLRWRGEPLVVCPRDALPALNRHQPARPPRTPTTARLTGVPSSATHGRTPGAGAGAGCGRAPQRPYNRGGG
jgi:hypothetical protein